ncbi:ACT domain-containing protein [Candidatus Pacearchaeota archaeon CG10_big_fil_rev_8_21_14_0_10_32_42]|nr:MAG: ACT domain-containing protein [Candidatus Pacearchaeota archaeon CG10_big_fil_rev_8_21_14_0_10_32_42]
MDEKIIKVRDEKFAVVKSKNFYKNAFANIKNENELTVIINEDEVRNEDIIKIEKGWKLITFDIVLDFGLVGFISKISSALAQKGISIFVISSYSTDHIMVKENKLNEALKVLKGLKI